MEKRKVSNISVDNLEISIVLKIGSTLIYRVIVLQLKDLRVSQ